MRDQKRSKTFKILSIAGALLVVGIGIVGFSLKTRSAHQLAENEAKWAILKPAHVHGKSEGKSSNPIGVQPLLHGTVEIQPGSSFTLQGRIEARRNFANLKWSWALPEGVRVVAGHAEGEINQVEQGQLIDVEITLVSDQADPGLIHLHAFEMQGETALGNVTQFVTHSGVGSTRAPAAGGLQKLSVEAHTESTKPLLSEAGPVIQ